MVAEWVQVFNCENLYNTQTSQILVLGRTKHEKDFKPKKNSAKKRKT